METDEFDVTITCDYPSSDGLRKVTAVTCSAVCSRQIDIALDGDIIRGVQFTGGCHGNTQGLAALCCGMKIKDVIRHQHPKDSYPKGRATGFGQADMVDSPSFPGYLCLH